MTAHTWRPLARRDDEPAREPRAAWEPPAHVSDDPHPTEFSSEAIRRIVALWDEVHPHHAGLLDAEAD